MIVKPEHVKTFSAGDAASAIIASPDAAAIVALLLGRIADLNTAATFFVCDPANGDRATALAISMVATVETINRIGEGAGLDRLSAEAMEKMTPRIAAMLTPTVCAVERVQRASAFAFVVWQCAGGEVGPESVNIAYPPGHKPH